MEESDDIRICDHGYFFALHGPGVGNDSSSHQIGIRVDEQR